MTFTTLEDLCLDIIDCPHSSPEWKESGVPVIRNFNLNNTGIDLSNLSYVDEGTYEQRIKRAKPEAGDIVISREAPIGMVGIIPDGLKCCLGQRLVLLKVDKEKCDPYYLLYVLGSDYVQTQTKRIDLTGSIVSNLNIPDLKKIVIPVIDDQQRVANLLHAITRKVENNNKINAELEEMAKTVYDYWFLQFEFPNEEGKPYKSSGGEMVWEEELKEGIPVGWKTKNIMDLCDIIDCLHSKKPEYCYENDGCYLLTTDNMTHDGYIDMSKKYYISRTEYQKWTKNIEITENDFVVTNAGRAGDIAKIPKDIKCAIGRNLTAIRAKDIDPYYLRQFLKSDLMKKQIMNNLDSGSFFSSFNVKSIKNINILIPDAKTLKKIHAYLRNTIVKIENNNSENQELITLRDFLLPLLMNGQVGFKN